MSWIIFDTYPQFMTGMLGEQFPERASEVRALGIPRPFWAPKMKVVDMVIVSIDCFTESEPDLAIQAHKICVAAHISIDDEAFLLFARLRITLSENRQNV